MKHRNLSDKRSKRKIVAENRRLMGENAVLRCVLMADQVMLQAVIAQKSQPPKFEEGGIVVPAKDDPSIGINYGPPQMSDEVFQRVKQSVENSLGQGIAILLPYHEANQKKETR